MAMAIREATSSSRRWCSGVKYGGGLRLDVEDADDLVLDDERNGQLGADVGVGVDVVFGLGDVFDEEGFALECGLPDDAAAELDAHALDLGAWPTWKRIRRSWVRSLIRRMAKMR